MSPLRYGYVSNGLTDHRLPDALALLADHGYDGVALTLDHHHLDPLAPDAGARAGRLAHRLAALGLACTVETGARFVLDPRRKHHPTLVSEGRQRRIGLLRRAIALAAELGAPVVSVWSGSAPPGAPAGTVHRRLVAGCEAVLAEADRRGVTLGFEPEPGMVVETLDDFDRLATALGHHRRLGLTLDVGHCLCVEPASPADCVRRAGPRLVHVHLEDMRRGVHEHLDFGDGDLDPVPVLAALAALPYRGLVAVELPRHSHLAHRTVPRAIEVLRRAEAASHPAPARAR